MKDNNITTPNDGDVSDSGESIENEVRRDDGPKLVAPMARATGQPPGWTARRWS